VHLEIASLVPEENLHVLESVICDQVSVARATSDAALEGEEGGQVGQDAAEMAVEEELL